MPQMNIFKLPPETYVLRPAYVLRDIVQLMCLSYSWNNLR